MDDLCSQNWCLYHEIELGAEFFFSEEDYVGHQDVMDYRRRYKIKVESLGSTTISSASSSSGNGSPRGRKRPRRAAAAVPTTSYVVPDSDDEAIADGNLDPFFSSEFLTKAKKKTESNLSLWIKHLSILLKEEQRKVGDYYCPYYRAYSRIAVQGQEETDREDYSSR